MEGKIDKKINKTSQKLKTNRAKIVGGVVLALGLLIVGVIYNGAKVKTVAKKEGEGSDLEKVTYTIRKEIYENNIEIAGNVSAPEEQKLQALSDGTVLGVYKKKGDKVKKGQIIIALDKTEQEYNLAKLDYDIDSKRMNSSPREMELLEKQRLSLLQRIEDRKVKATFNGVIAALDVAVGDSLEAKDSCGTLVNLDYLVADVEVAETDVALLKVGQEVEFNFPACEGTVLGYVVSWPSIGEVTSRGASVVKARVRIDDYPSTILPNYSFTGKIKITKPAEYLVVEGEAIGYEEKGGSIEEEDKAPSPLEFVILADSGKKVRVKTAKYGEGFVRITESSYIKDQESVKDIVKDAEEEGKSNNFNNFNYIDINGGVSEEYLAIRSDNKEDVQKEGKKDRKVSKSLGSDSGGQEIRSKDKREEGAEEGREGKVKEGRAMPSMQVLVGGEVLKAQRKKRVSGSRKGRGGGGPMMPPRK